MKNLYSVLLASTLFIFYSSIANSQSFGQGSLTGAIGIGIGIYGTNTNNTSGENSGTAAWLLPIEVEYGLTDKFGLGLIYQYGGYLTDQDSSEAGTTHNIGAHGYFHFMVKEKSTLYAKAGIGYTNFTYENNQGGGNFKVGGGGVWVNLGLGWRKMFGERVGIFFSADYSIMPINKFKDDNGDVLQTNFPPEDFRITIHGLDLKTGLVIKIM